MYNELRDADAETNKIKKNLIKDCLTSLKKAIKNVPADDVLTIEKNKNIIDIVERILEFIDSNKDKD